MAISPISYSTNSTTSPMGGSMPSSSKGLLEAEETRPEDEA